MHRRRPKLLFRAFCLLLFAGLMMPVSSSAQKAPESPVKRARVVRHVYTTAKVVALTFDDGPSPMATPHLLDYLKQEKVHATFFLIGQEAVRFPSLALRIAQEGHEIGNHGMHHKALRGLGREAMQDEISQGEETLTSIGIPKPTLYRVPKNLGSSLGYTILGEKGYTVVGWSVDPRDYQRRSSSAIVEDVMKHVGPGDIVIFHDGPGRKASTLAAVKEIVPRLKQSGYRLVTVSALLKVPMRAS